MPHNNPAPAVLMRAERDRELAQTLRQVELNIAEAQALLEKARTQRPVPGAMAPSLRTKAAEGGLPAAVQMGHVRRCLFIARGASSAPLEVKLWGHGRKVLPCLAQARSTSRAT
ncbi:hypothetical protein HaLaN_11881, partial [Haematococcus lacustris]